MRRARTLLTLTIGTVACLTGLWVAHAATQQSDVITSGDAFLTALATDKPIYRAAESVFIRGVRLNALSRTPLAADQQYMVQTQVLGPRGETVFDGWLNAAGGTFGTQWVVPEGQPGGSYQVKCSFPTTGDPPAERSFEIRAYQPPRFKSQITFVRDGYGPGDTVQASISIERSEGGAAAELRVTGIARVDGAEVFRGPMRRMSDTLYAVDFPLPESIERGEGTFAAMIEDGGANETATKTLPILLQTLDLSFYPEGGDLVVDLPARVYFEARRPDGKPADIAGSVFDSAGNAIAGLRSVHEGRGQVDFTPRAGLRYELRLNAPAGITRSFPLPDVLEHGAVLRADTPVTGVDETIRLRVGATDAGPLTVTLSQRSRELAALTIEPPRGELTALAIRPPADTAGVLTATVWDASHKPLAERLIFRQPKHQLQIELQPTRSTYTPASPAEVLVRVRDESGRPVAAWLGLTITDDSVLEMIERREQAPRLPAMALLESEVRELADAHVYLDPTSPTAGTQLDLLLGTQGWRRFAYFDAQTFLTARGDAARRVLGFRDPSLVLRTAGFDGAILDEVRRGGVWAAHEVPAAAAAPMRRIEPLEFGLADVQDRKDAALQELGIFAEQADKQALFIAELRQKAADELAAARFWAGEGGGRGIAPTLVAVREYAHKSPASSQPEGPRSDFTETVYWCESVQTDAQTGEARVRFNLSQAVTSFRILADAFDQRGALGAAATLIQSVEPFTIEPRLPIEVTAGDVVDLPVTVSNRGDTALEHVQLDAEIAGDSRCTAPCDFTLEADTRSGQTVRVTVGTKPGEFELTLKGHAAERGDAATHKLVVAPLGFPFEIAFGGILNPDGVVEQEIEIPADVVSHSLATTVAAYPTPLANLTQALQALIREPSGCFEQTSSTTYPLTMAQQYFLTHSGVNPKLIEDARSKLERGYQRLVGYECKQRGFEWFGADPGHEALTAYGLLQFVDMSKVRSVDASMLQRTRGWLLARRDGNGGFRLDSKALDTFGRAPRETTHAYVVWALLESGENGLSAELDELRRIVAVSKDTYILALAANAFALAGDSAAARGLMQRLDEAQAADGHVDAALTSITSSGGDALKIETTALAVLAWLRDPAFTGSTAKAMRFIADSCKNGRYASTQSTVLALRAITAYDKARQAVRKAGALRLSIDGQSIGGPVNFDGSSTETLMLPDFAELLSPGKHVVRLEMKGGTAMPCSLAVRLHRLQPPSSSECKLNLAVRLSHDKIAAGEIGEMQVEVTNRTDQPVPTPIAIISLPGGAEPRHDQLKELVKAGRISAYEVRGREVVLYWRGLSPNQQVEIPLTVVAAVPGTYTAPASRAYEYYTDEHKVWVAGPRLTITAD